jgi:hypothetical protein
MSDNGIRGWIHVEKVSHTTTSHMYAPYSLNAARFEGRLDALVRLRVVECWVDIPLPRRHRGVE